VTNPIRALIFCCLKIHSNIILISMTVSFMLIDKFYMTVTYLTPCPHNYLQFIGQEHSISQYRTPCKYATVSIEKIAAVRRQGDGSVLLVRHFNCQTRTQCMTNPSYPVSPKYLCFQTPWFKRAERQQFGTNQAENYFSRIFVLLSQHYYPFKI
jgi:hypothetical protein